MAFIHLDEAKRAAIEHVKHCVHEVSGIERALLGVDLFGKLRVILWASPEAFEQAQARLRADLESACGRWWTGEVLSATEVTESDRTLWEHAWDEARAQPDIVRLRILDRHRSRTAWFLGVSDPLWNAPHDGPPVVVFYSFKGGLGRSTALASFAMQRARGGERVAVVDFDLDAPGVGRLLAADDKGTTSPWGTVDYLLEHGQGDVPLSDYYHPCRRVAGQGDIVVVPAGRLDSEYADKLARVDFEQASTEGRSPVACLLEGIRTELKPKWILLDARAGVSEPAGHLLSGLAHLHVLFGTTSEQTWQGLTVVIDRLGRERVIRGQPQAECLLVQALVPPGVEVARRASEAFAERARQLFTELYYAEEPQDPADERFWDVRDLESEDAPHVPVPIAYEQRLAHFGDVAEVADVLAESKDYRNLVARIAQRFEPEPEP
ncbi:MAG: hypothetical protein HY724_12085 [Candidatus Rokubacteria bacterium]|nr:hypothetical protein [Candidatus Rokubacteria bacterium]